MPARTQAPLKVFDTYLRALKRVVNLSNEVALLEEGVSVREAEALERILEHMAPLLPTLARPVSVREPWLEVHPENDRAYRHEGLVVRRSFEQIQGNDGFVTHHGKVLILVEGAHLIELTTSGAWREGPPVTDATWTIEATPVRVSPDFAQDHLRPILSGIMDALREALTRGRSDRDALKRRLGLLGEIDSLLAKAPRP